MHSKLHETVILLASEGWSELQDNENALPMRQWGVDLLTLLTKLYGENTIINILDNLYAETYPNEESVDSDDF